MRSASENRFNTVSERRLIHAQSFSNFLNYNYSKHSSNQSSPLAFKRLAKKPGNFSRDNCLPSLETCLALAGAGYAASTLLVPRCRLPAPHQLKPQQSALAISLDTAQSVLQFFRPTVVWMQQASVESTAFGFTTRFRRQFLLAGLGNFLRRFEQRFLVFLWSLLLSAIRFASSIVR